MLLRLVGLDPHHYSGHSFRIGGAQSSSIAGLNDYEIKLLGCLSSDCFKRYIRYPLSLLLTVTPRLAKTKDIPYQYVSLYHSRTRYCCFSWATFGQFVLCSKICITLIRSYIKLPQR